MDSVMHNRGSVDGVVDRMNSVVSDRVGNNTVMDSVVRHRVSHQAVVSHGVSDHGMAEVRSMAGVGHDSTVAVVHNV